MEYAVQVNSIPFQNVYIGAALRRPDFGGGRSKKGDAIALTFIYSDQDDPGAASFGLDVCKQVSCLPSASVITGRIPHERVQFLWRLDKPSNDNMQCENLVSTIAERLHGDHSVKNWDRVLRLAGSIAGTMIGLDKGVQIGRRSPHQEQPAAVPSRALLELRRKALRPANAVIRQIFS